MDSPNVDQSSVIRIIRDRISGKTDGHKLGLAVEGGGMRGIVSGAMLIGLKEAGAADVFDGFYGTSSGSINVAYFCAGATWDGLSVYSDFLPSKDFISLKRGLVCKAPMSMDFLFEDVMGRQVPLDYEGLYERVQDRSLRLGVAVSDVSASMPRLITEFDSPDHLKRSLRGGATLPVIAGGPYDIGDSLALDGGALYPAPFYPAIEDGCTHVLAIGTRPWASQRLGLSWWQHPLAFQLNRWKKGLGGVYKKLNLESYPERASLRAGDSLIRGATVFHLRPDPGTHDISRLTMDRPTLVKGAGEAFRHAYRAISGDLDGPLPSFDLR